jgi:hypothetical protein
MGRKEDAFTRGTEARVATRGASFARRFAAAKWDVRPNRLRRPNLDPTDAIFAVRQVIHYAGFACRSVWRRKIVVLVSFFLTFSMIAGATRLAPRTYHIEVKMLTQHSIIIASLTNPARVIPYDVYAPTRAAAEMVLRRDNITSLIRQTDLLSEWDRTRSPILRLSDRWMALVRGHEPTADEKLDDLVEQIERRMFVETDPGSDGLVTISLEWPDPHSGYLLVERAQQSFLQARQVAETQAITEALKLLEGYATTLRSDLQSTLDELARTRGLALSEQAMMLRPERLARPIAGVLDVAGPAGLTTAEDDPLVDPGTLVDPRLGRLKNAAATKRSELVRLESDQKRKLDELQAQLAVAQTIYTPNHPSIQSLQQNVAALRHDSPQIVLLRHDLDELETKADEQAALAAERLIRATIRQHVAAPRKPAAAPRDGPPTTPARTDTPNLPGRARPDAVVEFATARLRTQLSQLHGVLERTDAARIELEIAKGAFKHRYSVVSPAEEPSTPTFPNTPRILFAGLVASAIFALAAAVAADISGKRILEAWQLQRQLGLRVLGAARVL